MTNPSRRSFTGLLLGLLLPKYRAWSQAAPSPGEPALGLPLRRQARRYRADVTILVFGMPVFRRSGVGGGQALYQEIEDGGSARKTLFFAAGSDPERAQGVKRLGWFREEVIASGADPTEATYFGVLSCSPEESLDKARKSAGAPSASQSAYSAVRGANTKGRSRSALTHFEYRADASWSDERLITEAQSAFHDGVSWRETSWPKSPASAPPTFLFELARLLAQRGRRASGRYVYNEQEYKLELETESGDGRLLTVLGRLRNLRTGRRTEFHLWLEDAPGSVVPVRIEFQPRSFLRLTFEAEAA